jgi:hypothetical protein
LIAVQWQGGIRRENWGNMCIGIVVVGERWYVEGIQPKLALDDLGRGYRDLLCFLRNIVQSFRSSGVSTSATTSGPAWIRILFILGGSWHSCG